MQPIKEYINIKKKKFPVSAGRLFPTSTTLWLTVFGLRVSSSKTECRALKLMHFLSPQIFTSCCFSLWIRSLVFFTSGSQRSIKSQSKVRTGCWQGCVPELSLWLPTCLLENCIFKIHEGMKWSFKTLKEKEKEGKKKKTLKDLRVQRTIKVEGTLGSFRPNLLFHKTANWHPERVSAFVLSRSAMSDSVWPYRL